jgi:DNA processing protein
VTACTACLTRAWLLQRLGGHLDLHRDRLGPLLTLPDRELIAALGGRQRAALTREHAAFDPGVARSQATKAGLRVVCRCRPEYPPRLLELEMPPAVLHIAGQTPAPSQPAVAIVGTRRPSPYGLDMSRALARGSAAAGITVISGLALGIDAAAHTGALGAGGPTLAVLAAGSERAYPARNHRLYARIAQAGAIVSELPPQTSPRRWMFPARNRLIAALADLVIVVEARERSGALVTARHASQLGRAVGAVPGRVTSLLARGPHGLLRHGARLIEGPEDILDALFDSGSAELARAAMARPAGPALPDDLQALLDALAEGHPTPSALSRASLEAETGLAALAALELAGRVRREAGGRYSVLP